MESRKLKRSMCSVSGLGLSTPKCAFQITVLENLLRGGAQLRAAIGSLKVDRTAVGFFKEQFPRGLVGWEPGLMNDKERAGSVHQQPGHEEQTQVEVRSAIDFVEGDHEVLLGIDQTGQCAP